MDKTACRSPTLYCTNHVQLVSAAPNTATDAKLVGVSAEPVYDNNRATRDFVGYNIYKNGELLEALWPDNFYDYNEMQIGYYCYTVTAEYSYCGESAPSNEACVDIIVGVNEIGAGEARLYPNPATDRVTVEAKAMKHLTVTNYVGQVVYNAELSGENRAELNTSAYGPGVYVVRITTANGIVTKRVVIAE